YFIDAVGASGSGVVMSAQDGAFNSPSEAVTATLSAATFDRMSVVKGKIYEHGKDAVGNWSATVSAVFTKYTRGRNASGVVVRTNPATAAPTVQATINDSTTGTAIVVAAVYFIDAVEASGSGVVMSAQDGAFNSPSEAVTATLSATT